MSPGAAAGLDEDVARLEVTVHDRRPVAMQVLQGAGDAQSNNEPVGVGGGGMLPRGRIPLDAVDVRLERRPTDELEHERHLPGLGVHDGPEEHRDVRVPDLAQRAQLGKRGGEAPRLAAEAPHRNLHSNAQPQVRAKDDDALPAAPEHVLGRNQHLRRIQEPMLLFPHLREALQGRAGACARDALLEEVARADAVPGGLDLARLVLARCVGADLQRLPLPTLGQLELRLSSQRALDDQLLVRRALLDLERSLPIE
mmetsp:Transcript_48048/g.138386  ORF Transcript_48048/g.138386 Transcript_48048/m.138386 type:complete len:255 (+) Transcript_48048:188-952(+)